VTTHPLNNRKQVTDGVSLKKNVILAHKIANIQRRGSISSFKTWQPSLLSKFPSPTLQALLLIILLFLILTHHNGCKKGNYSKMFCGGSSRRTWYLVCSLQFLYDSFTLAFLSLLHVKQIARRSSLLICNSNDGVKTIQNNITHVTTHVQSKIQDRSRRAQTDRTNVKMFNKRRIYSLVDINKTRLKIVRGFHV